ncbi:MAG: cytochrome c [Campylobacterota bacterium]
MKLTKVSLLIAGLMVTTSVFAGAEEGKEMFEEAKCMECHNTEDFTDSKKVHNFKEIEKRVEACRLNTGIGWFEEDVTDVAEYLNQEFYKFKK